jgi:predicted nucleic-acid-binding Zn-ribbon protein
MTNEEWEDLRASLDQDISSYHTDKKGDSERLYEAMDLLRACGAKDSLGADHDIIYLPTVPIENMLLETAKRLYELGVSWSEEFDCWIMTNEKKPSRGVKCPKCKGDEFERSFSKLWNMPTGMKKEWILLTCQRCKYHFSMESADKDPLDEDELNDALDEEVNK